MSKIFLVIKKVRVEGLELKNVLCAHKTRESAEQSAKESLVLCAEEHGVEVENVPKPSKSYKGDWIKERVVTEDVEFYFYVEETDLFDDDEEKGELYPCLE